MYDRRVAAILEQIPALRAEVEQLMEEAVQLAKSEFVTKSRELIRQLGEYEQLLARERR
ncbi:MAG: hypothetical protein H0Z35_01555 [Thermoanaerobacteraceae bacterium]|nr:hypothetical protein [Thermoanaerobacteraceae bacterium]